MGYKARLILYVIYALIILYKETILLFWPYQRGTLATNQGRIHLEGLEKQLSVEVVDLEKNWEIS